jgi:hypothetical protein
MQEADGCLRTSADADEGRAAATLGCGRSRAWCPVVGCGLVGRGSGAAGQRVDDRCRAPAGVLQCGSRHRQRPRGGRCCRPMGDDARFPGRRGMRGHHGLGAKAGRLSGAADLDGRRARRPASRVEPRTRRGRGLGATYVRGSGRPCSLGGLAGRGPAAGAFRAVGAAAGRLGQHFGDIARRPAVVRRGTGHGRRTGGPGGAAPGRDANALAGASDPVLPPTYGSAARPVRY